METEIWKPIPGYEGLYEASNLGRVKSLYKEVKGRNDFIRKLPEKILKPIIKSNGYCTVMLYKDNKVKRYYIHRIVVFAFLGNSNLHVNHIDKNKLNNFLNNLELISQRENNCHMFNSVKANKLRGVKPSGNKFYALITIKGKRIYKGSFDTEKEAHEAYLQALKEHGLQNKYATKNQE
jgi:hypothetical protein